MTEQFANASDTTLSGAINNSVTSLAAADASTFPSSGDFRIRIDDEIIIVGARSSNTLSSLTRGAEGSTAASHSSGAALTHVLTAAALDAGITDRLKAADVTLVDAGNFYGTDNVEAALQSIPAGFKGEGAQAYTDGQTVFGGTTAPVNFSNFFYSDTADDSNEGSDTPYHFGIGGGQYVMLLPDSRIGVGTRFRLEVHITYQVTDISKKCEFYIIDQDEFVWGAVGNAYPPVGADTLYATVHGGFIIPDPQVENTVSEVGPYYFQVICVAESGSDVTIGKSAIGGALADWVTGSCLFQIEKLR